MEDGEKNDSMRRVNDLSSIDIIRDDSFFQRPGNNYNNNHIFISLHYEESEDHKNLQELSNIMNSH